MTGQTKIITKIISRILSTTSDDVQQYVAVHSRVILTEIPPKKISKRRITSSNSMPANAIVPLLSKYELVTLNHIPDQRSLTSAQALNVDLGVALSVHTTVVVATVR